MSSKKKIVETRDTIGATFKELGFKPTASNGKSADHRATLNFPLESPLPAVVMYMEVAS